VTEAEDPEPVKVLVVSGDEALTNPDVRALAEQAEHVIAICMFATAARGLADLILPGTSYLERDGTFVNLEGRVQRLRRAVIPPVPDELAWLSKLADRFGVHVSPYPASAFEELSALLYDGMPFGEIGEKAQLHPRTPADEPVPAVQPEPAARGMRLVAYRPLFSGPAVERVPELQFQRPPAELEVARADAERLGIRNGDEVNVRSNGTSVRLRARLSRTVRPGIVRAAQEHVGDLKESVEVTRA
jgi:predicted molibdopterin-dependent oxidoreductase YjgC